MNADEHYMSRCLQLATLGAGTVAPNPMVGAVLVYNGTIIGEGYHQKFGEAHAEINCLASVKEEDRKFIKNSVLYISLEPCAHFGKTPPCVDSIISNNIPHVVIACRDRFEAVNGKGVQKLLSAGIKVTEQVLASQALQVNKRFFTFNEQKRPYVILKWAQSKDGYIAATNAAPAKISNEITDKLVHKWRSEEAAILVGTQTALVDNPSLTTRLWMGKNPVRIVIDLNLRLPAHLKLFDGKSKTILINFLKEDQKPNLQWVKIDLSKPVLTSLLEALKNQGLSSLLVEGGAKLLQSFIQSGLWDEARVITNEVLQLHAGLRAPDLNNFRQFDEQKILSDKIQLFQNLSSIHHLGIF